MNQSGRSGSTMPLKAPSRFELLIEAGRGKSSVQSDQRVSHQMTNATRAVATNRLNQKASM
jgi:hypothetical protein